MYEGDRNLPAYPNQFQGFWLFWQLRFKCNLNTNPPNNVKDLAYLNKYFWKYKGLLSFGILFTIISVLFQIIPAQLVRYAFDSVSDMIKIYPLYDEFENQQDTIYELFAFSVLLYGVLIVIMALIRGVFLFMVRQTIIVMSRHIEYDLKNEIFKQYQNLPLSFYRRNNTGDLMARISEDVNHVRMYLGPVVMYGLSMLISFTLVVSFMLSIHIKLTVFSLLPLPVLSFGIYYINSIVNRQSTKIQESLSQMTSFVQEAFSGIRVLKSFVREDDSYQQFTLHSEDYKVQSLKLAMVNALFFPMMLLLIGFSTILTIYVGGIEVIDGTITAGNIAEFIIYINMLTWPVAALGWISSMAQRAAASQKRINEFLQEENDIISTENISKSIAGKITLRNVCFTYADSGIEALQNIDMQINAGETVAILGTTGSGKSTFANMLCRLYDATEGEILVDDTPIKNYNLDSLRSQLGYVPQDVFLFSDSIRNNIRFGVPKLTEEELVQASEDADLQGNIEQFPKGFDTELGERGITLSGGQKQRVSIARAIARNPRIMILDDCLSAVDTKTENTILNNLKRIMKNRTSIVISHRVSSAKLADKIYVLDDGKIVENGTHQELINQNGTYKELYDKQLQSEEEAVS